MLSFVALLATAVVAEFAPTDYVRPLIGTDGGGHVFPGPSLPFSLSKPGPDCIGDDNQGGFHPGSAIHGFSQLHDDGTGGAQSLGNFPIVPHSSCADDDWKKCPVGQTERAKNYTAVSASPGYFSCALNDSSAVELTTTRRTALHHYTFPEDKSPVLAFDLNDMARSRSAGEVKIQKNGTRIVGSSTFMPSFGDGTYQSYFCADIKSSTPVTSYGVYSNDKTYDNDTLDNSMVDGNAGALVQFEKGTRDVMVRVGLSFMSTDQACENGESEASSFDFNSTVNDAKKAWNEQLSNVNVTSPGSANNSDQLTLFYSSLYRTYLSPQNYTGESQAWKTNAPVFSSFYCIWDLYRTTFPLYSIFAPNAEVEMLNSLLDIYDHRGWLPDCRMAFNPGWTQGGSDADNVFADAYLKGIGKDSVNWTKAYEALVKDAEVEPPVWDVEGRGGIESWKELHYIPKDDNDTLGRGLKTRSGSRTLEYAYNDFAVSILARAVNNSDACNKYLKRSDYWKNIWRTDIESAGFKGFLQPKFANGSWAFQDPKFCSPVMNFTSCFLNENGGEFYEASSWTYSLLPAHDYASLVDMVGGPETLVKRLDAFFHQGYQDVGDEIGWLPIFLGHYIGNTTIAIDRIRELIPAHFNTSMLGIPGNDDSGAMASFSVFTMLGFYPNAGQNVYLLTSPFFNETAITNEITNKTARITAHGLSDENIYIQSAKLNGNNHDQAWISHDFFTSGGHLEYQMGSSPSNWGKTLPPSVSNGDYDCDKPLI